MQASIHHLQFLFGSCERVELFDEVVRNAQSPGDLAVELPISRRTVHRHLADLSDRQLLVKRGVKYYPTTAGRLLHDVCRTAMKHTGTIAKCRSVLNELPWDERLDPAWFVDALLHRATPEQPFLTAKHVVATIAASESKVRVLTPSIGWWLLDSGLDTASLDLITRAPDERGCCEGYRSTLLELDRSEGVSVRTTDQHPPVGIVITDAVTHLLGYDESNRLVESLESDDEDFRAWATRRFTAQKRQSMPVSAAL